MLNKNSFRLLFTAILIIAITGLSSCSSSDDSPPDSTDDSGMDGSDDSTDDDATDETLFFISSVTTRDVDGTLISDRTYTYNSENQLMESAPVSYPSNKVFYVYEGDLITQIDFINAIDGQRIKYVEYFYNAQDQLSRSIFYVSDNVFLVDVYEYDSLDRLVRTITYDDDIAFENNEISYANEFYYDEDNDLYEERFIDYFSDGTTQELVRKRVTQFQEPTNLWNLGDAANKLRHSFILGISLPQRFANSQILLEESYNVDLDTDEIDFIIYEAEFTSDENGNVNSATFKVYSDDGSGTVLTDRTIEIEFVELEI